MSYTETSETPENYQKYLTQYEDLLRKKQKLDKQIGRILWDIYVTGNDLNYTQDKIDLDIKNSDEKIDNEIEPPQ